MKIRAVIRSRVRFLGMRGWEWYVVSSPLRYGRLVDEHNALDFIRRHHLVKVYSDADGDVYDTPDRAFYNAYHDEVAQNRLSGGYTYTRRMDIAWDR